MRALKSFPCVFILSCLWIVYGSATQYYTWQQDHYYALVDGDMLMRYLRVFDLVQSGDWYNNFIRRDNYPYGNLIPWTRLFDLVVLLPAALFKVLAAMDWKDAIFWSGTIISPILYMISVAGLLWAAKPLRFGIVENALMVLFFLFNPYSPVTFLFGRGDHHSLLCGLFIGVIGAFLRLLEDVNNRRQRLVVVVLLALGLWVSAEFLAAIFFCMTVLAVLYMLHKPDIEKAISELSVLLVVLCIPLVLLEKPPADFLVVENDRISIVHVALFFFVSCGAWLNIKLDPYLRSRKNRILILIVEFIALFAAMAWLFPRFYLGPYAAFTPEQIKAWFPNIEEMRSILWQREPFIFFLLLSFGIGLTGLRISFQQKEVTFNQGLFIAATLVGYTALFCVAARWNYYLMPVLAIGCGLFCKAVTTTFSSYKTKQKAMAVVGGIVAAVLLLPRQDFSLINEKITYDETHWKCQTALYYMVENGILDNYANFDGKVVMTTDNIPPWLLFWTGARTIGSNYTRNVEGMRDTNVFYETRDRKVFDDILKRRHVEYIMVCPASKPDAQKQINRLIAGDKSFARWQRIHYPLPKIPFLKGLPPDRYPLVYRRRG